MMTLAARLHLAIVGAGISIESVSIGRQGDRSTWTVVPASQQAAAQSIIDAFEPPTAAQLAEEEADEQTQTKQLRAVALALWECIPNPTMTKAQLGARAKAIYKAL